MLDERRRRRRRRRRPRRRRRTLAGGGAVDERRGEHGPQHRAGHEVGAELLEHDRPLDDAEAAAAGGLGEQQPEAPRGRPARAQRSGRRPRPRGRRRRRAGTGRRRSGRRSAAARPAPRPSGTPSTSPGRPRRWKHLDVNAYGRSRPRRRREAIGERRPSAAGAGRRARASPASRSTTPSARTPTTRRCGAQLGAYLDELAYDDAIKVVLLRGEGGVFSTGADMNNAYAWYGDGDGDRRGREAPAPEPAAPAARRPQDVRLLPLLPRLPEGHRRRGRRATPSAAASSWR